MINSFEWKGKWRIPDTEIWENGTLYFSQDQGVKLFIDGSSKDTFKNDFFAEIISGYTQLMDNITLVDCHRVTYFITQNDTSSYHVYWCSYIIQGKLFLKKSDISFKKIKTRLFNLIDWTNTSGIEVYKDEGNNEVLIKYSQPSNIEFAINEKAKGNIIFKSYWEGVFKNGQTVIIKDDCWVEIVYHSEIYFADILKDLTIFHNLISLMINVLSYPISISFESHVSANSDSTTEDKALNCYYQDDYYHQSEIKNDFLHLVNYERIQNLFSSVVQKWFDVYNIIEPSLRLLLFSFQNKEAFKVETFLDIVRAIETFHIRTYTYSEDYNQKLKDKIERIINDIKLEKDKTYVRENLMDKFRPPLKDRLLQLLKKYDNNFLRKFINDREQFCFNSFKSRNYYTHLDPEQKQFALEGYDLYDLKIKLLGLLFSSIFSYIGIPKETFEDKLELLYN